MSLLFIYLYIYLFLFFLDCFASWEKRRLKNNHNVKGVAGVH